MQRFVPPLLDRLIDLAPSMPAEPLSASMSLEQLKTTVARDVESLLNSRHGPETAHLAEHANARRSVLSFGLEDFSSMSMSSHGDREAVCRSIERAIANHERRLRDVRVSLTPDRSDTQKLRFAIQALLIVHPLQEPVSFDAVLQTTTQSYDVQNTRRAA